MSSLTEADPEFVAKGAAAAIGVVLTVAAAVPVIDKRLARVADIERELGTMGGPVRMLYVWPQKILKLGLIVLTLIGVLAVLAYIFPGFDHPAANFLRSQGLVIILVWFVLGIAAYTNFFSWVGLYLIHAASALTPVRSILLGGKRVDDEPTWAALRVLVNYNESAKPMIVDRMAARILADFLLRAARQDPSAGEQNRAAPPNPPPTTKGGKDRLGNALLVACVIEGAHSSPHSAMPKRNWRPFYEAAKQLALEPQSPFAPERVRSDPLAALVETMIGELNTILRKAIEPEIPRSAVLEENLRACLNHLRRDHQSRVTKIDPGWGGLLRSRAERIRRRVEAVPGLGPGMQAQFVKLAIVWGIWRGVSVSGFRAAGAARIAALLLNRGVIATLAETKIFNLSQPDGRQVYRVAMAALIEEAVRLVDVSPDTHRAWLPAAALSGSPAARAWMTAYEVDYRLYDYAKRLAEDAVTGETMKPWTVAEGHISRP